MDKETLRMQMLSGVITESEYKAKLEESKKDSLNEHYVAGGIVGIGAINQIPSRAKADYEDAFEHFLGQKYNLNEMEDDMPEAPSHEETDAAQVYEANPLEGGPGYMTKYRVGVLSALIADAEKDLIKYEEEGLLSPELTEKMKGTIEKLKSSREALKAQYREETGKDVKEVEEKSLYEAESPTKEEIAAFEAAVEQLMNMAGMSREDATMAIGRAANAKK